MAKRLTTTGKLINVAIVIAFLGILFGIWTQIPECTTKVSAGEKVTTQAPK